MKIQFSLILLGLLLSIQSFAIVIPVERMEGSFFCNNLSITLDLYNLEDRYQYFVQVNKSTQNQQIEIIYDLVKLPTADSVKSITVDLTSYFNLNDLYSSQLSWDVIETVSIDGATVRNDWGMGLPFRTCSEIKSTCDTVTVYRKRAEEICPVLLPVIRPEFAINNDSIGYSFNDTTETPVAICTAQGYLMKTDSLKITGMKAKNYRVIERTNTDPNCPIFFTCGGSLWYTEVGKADLSACVIDGFKQQMDERISYPTLVTNNNFRIAGYNGEVSLSNSIGKTFFIKGNEDFNTSELPKGVYILNLSLEGKAIREKIIIK